MSWGRVGALRCRLTQRDLPGGRARLSWVVDDPLLAVRGPKRRWRRLAYIFITVWYALGFPLTFRKGDPGTKIAWIGAKLTAHDDKVVARAKEDILDDLSQDIEEATARNFTTKSGLRTLVGRASHVATLFRVGRPVSLRALGGHSLGEPDAPTVRSDYALAHSLYARQEGDHRERLYIVVDASPWGLGGVLQVEANLVEYFASLITEADLKRFDLKHCDRAGLQV